MSSLSVTSGGRLTSNSPIVPFYGSLVPAKDAMTGANTGKYVLGKPYDKAAVANYLKRELKIDLHDTQEKSLVEALTEPKAYLDRRKKGLDDIAEKIAEPYQTSIKYYYELGYPSDEAVKLADISAKAMYDVYMNELNARMPGASVLITGAVDKHDGQVKQAALISGNEKDIDYYKRKAKSRKVKKSTA
jgi:hypothetical protein